MSGFPCKLANCSSILWVKREREGRRGREREREGRRREGEREREREEDQEENKEGRQTAAYLSPPTTRAARRSVNFPS